MKALPTSEPSLWNSCMNILWPCAETSKPFTHVSAVTGPLRKRDYVRVDLAATRGYDNDITQCAKWQP